MKRHERATAFLKVGDIVRTVLKNTEIMFKWHYGNKTRVEVFQKTLRKGLTLSFDLSNYNEDLMAVFAQGTKVSLGAGTGTRIAHGIEEPSIEYRTFRLAATREDGKHYIIDIPKAEISIGETTLGGETESVLPMTLTAVYNPNVGATASLYTELFLESSLNATAIPSSGY
jgi:hypothetical protein